MRRPWHLLSVSGLLALSLFARAEPGDAQFDDAQLDEAQLPSDPATQPESKGAVNGPSSPTPVLGVTPVEEAHVTPQKWLSPLMRCGRRGARRFCDGPRRAPDAVGAAHFRRETLGLGTLHAGAQAIRAKVEGRWVDVVKAQGMQSPTELYWPIEGGWFGRGVGTGRERFRVHRGVDITADVGTPVHALADGMVVYADNSVPGYGNLLVVVHAGGEASSYAHLSEIRVAPGDFLHAGEVVALTGNTGLSRGPHLHFEWREGGRPADPMRRMATEHVPTWMQRYFEGHPTRTRRRRKGS